MHSLDGQSLLPGSSPMASAKGGSFSAVTGGRTGQLPWLRRLRWTAVVGQAAAVVFVDRVLGIALPVGPALAVIAAAAWSNVALHFVPSGQGERPGFLAAVLATDVVLLTLLLGATGGAYNPFTPLYLVMVALGAVALPPRLTWGVTALACGGCGWLFLGPASAFRPGDPVCGVGPDLPMELHLWGMLVAFGVTAGLVALFAGRLQEALRQRQGELAAARERMEQHERFAALATLAAGAAHELGTPLGTIVVAAGELAREVRFQDRHPAWLEDAELIRREAFRCREILDRLQHHAEDLPQEVEVGGVWEGLRVRFPGVRFPSLGTGERAVRLLAPPEALSQALANLIGNAVDASPSGSEVEVEVQRRADRVEFAVTDRGRGLSEGAAVHAGEPFFTTKPPGRGMGLGLYLVRLLARRMAGEFRFEAPAAGGTRAVLSLPVRAEGGGA